MSPKRMYLEQRSMAATRAVLMRLRTGELCWCDVMQSNRGNEYHTLIWYPPTFPYERPHAYIAQPAVNYAPHQYVDGTLCLFPSLDDPTLATTAGVVRGRVALWLLLFEDWRETGVWKEHVLEH